MATLKEKDTVPDQILETRLSQKDKRRWIPHEDCGGTRSSLYRNQCPFLDHNRTYNYAWTSKSKAYRLGFVQPQYGSYGLLPKLLACPEDMDSA